MLQVSQSCNQLRENFKDVTWCWNSVKLNVLLFNLQWIIYLKAQFSSEWHQILTSSFLFGQVYTSLKSDFKAFRIHSNEHTINHFAVLCLVEIVSTARSFWALFSSSSLSLIDVPLFLFHWDVCYVVVDNVFSPV